MAGPIPCSPKPSSSSHLLKDSMSLNRPPMQESPQRGQHAQGHLAMRQRSQHNHRGLWCAGHGSPNTATPGELCSIDQFRGGFQRVSEMHPEPSELLLMTPNEGEQLAHTARSGLDPKRRREWGSSGVFLAFMYLPQVVLVGLRRLEAHRGSEVIHAL